MSINKSNVIEAGQQTSETNKSNILGNKDAAANIAVKDLKIAKKFYEDTLGLK